MQLLCSRASSKQAFEGCVALIIFSYKCTCGFTDHGDGPGRGRPPPLLVTVNSFRTVPHAEPCASGENTTLPPRSSGAGREKEGTGDCSNSPTRNGVDSPNEDALEIVTDRRRGRLTRTARGLSMESVVMACAPVAAHTSQLAAVPPPHTRGNLRTLVSKHGHGTRDGATAPRDDDIVVGPRHLRWDDRQDDCCTVHKRSASAQPRGAKQHNHNTYGAQAETTRRRASARWGP